MFVIQLFISLVYSMTGNHTLNVSQPALLRRMHDLEHFECFNIVKLTQKYLLSGKEKAEIVSQLKERCGKFKQNRQLICEKITETKIDEIISLLNDKKNSQGICNALGFRRRYAEDAQISQSDCVQLVEKFRVQFKNFKPNSIRRPFFNSTRWGMFRKVQPSNQTTNNAAKLLESETNSTSSRPFGLHQENAVSDVKLRYFHNRVPFGLAPLCKELPENNRLACHIISRNVYKQYTHNVNQTAEEVCLNLNTTNLIRLI